ncbi:MAG: hypothetical protein C6I00_00385 [Nitratiruptor sp.]|nr:hypothetical protein [Nitratiruptor sp.]NPA83702.1 prepilin-type N-terminal cleavage/methylation domain-containing protein [Campylobacterota bacterium]
MKRAFTLLEIILVLVLIGILGAIGSELLFQFYEQYLLSQALSHSTTQLEVTLNIMERTLENKIPFTCIKRKDTDGSDFDDITTLQDPTGGYKVLECILYAQEARRGIYDAGKQMMLPGWSGLLDLYHAKTSKSDKTLYTPGSNLDKANEIIKALSHNQASLEAGKANVGLIFNLPPADVDIIEAMGWKLYQDPSNDENLRVYKVYAQDGQTLKVTNDFPDTAYDLYSLAYTAIAFVPEKQSDGSYKLYLYTNYRPWEAQTYKDGEKYLLAEHISNFYFKQKDVPILIKLCTYSKKSGSFDVITCSERTIW